MTVSDIRWFLREMGPASISDIARHFGADPHTAETMIDEWIRKGKVEKRVADSFSRACCGKSDSHRADLYAWIDG